MSERNREGKRTARERLREERERERATDRRKRVAKVAAAAIAALAIAGAVGVFAANSDNDSTTGPATDPIEVGEADAPVTMAVYEDFRCPACGQFEDTFRDTIHELTDAGKLRVDYHLVTIIDGNMGGNGSKHSANAAVCARDAGKFTEYHDVLYENQPSEADDAFADTSHLIDLATEVDGLDTATFRDCVENGTHEEWVGNSNAGFLDSDYNATPTILLDDENIYGDTEDPLTPERLRERVNELA